MAQQIFYSWQADTASACNKNLVSRALTDAIAVLNADAAVEDAQRYSRDERIALDHDTTGEPGSPPIVDTIFGKIDRAAAFVSDLTYVAERKDGRRMPNPNVLLEHGWALKALSWRAVISVMNTAHGHPKDHALPFDLQHARGPILFDCPDEADAETRGTVRRALAKALAPRLRATLDDATLRDARRSPAAEPHPHDLALIAQWKACLGDPLRRFLRDHDFGEAYRRKLLQPLQEIAAQWQGAQYELDDRELDCAFGVFHAANRAFCTLLTERTRPLDQNQELATAKTTLDTGFGLQTHTRETIARLNLAASALNDAIDRVDREIRIRIRVVVEPLVVAADPRRGSAEAALAELANERWRGGLPRIVSPPRMTLRIVPLAAFDGKRLDPGAVARAQRGFGSMGGAGTFASLVRQRNPELAAALDAIPRRGSVTEAQFDAYAEAFTAAFANERRTARLAPATRLLAMKRPDIFVGVNGENSTGLAEALSTKPTTMSLDNYWARVIVPIRQAPWYTAPRPNGCDMELWDARAAMLDAIYYAPGS